MHGEILDVAYKLRVAYISLSYKYITSEDPCSSRMFALYSLSCVECQFGTVWSQIVWQAYSTILEAQLFSY